MKTACIVLAVIAAILGIVIIILLLNDRKKRTAAESPDATGSAVPEVLPPASIAPVIGVSVKFHKPFVAAPNRDPFIPKEVLESVSADEVDNILSDEVAAELIEKGDGITDKTKTGIINIDTLSKHFVDGETVTLDEIKKRIKGFAKTTYIKVLARGILDKKLTVEADDFSLQAVKMIVLIGGKAIKK